MKLLIISTMKPMIEPFITEQTNSVLSWTKLKINPTIIIFGYEEGVPEFCKKYNLLNKDIKRNNKGVPYISHIFKDGYKYMEEHQYDYILYLNADILLLNDFSDTLLSFHKNYPHINSCLLTAIRYNIKNFYLIDYNDKNWETEFKKIIGEYSEPTGIDLFLHKKYNFNEIPDFAIARYGYDTYILDYAIKNFEMSVDITRTVKIYHHFGLWYQDNKIVDRNVNNIDQYSKSINDSLLDWNKIKYNIITQCKYYSKYSDDNEIIFI